MNQARAEELVAEIVRLVEDLQKIHAKDIHDFRVKRNPNDYTFGFRDVSYRNWNDAVTNKLPTGGFVVALWADVFGTYVGRAPILASPRVETFVEKWRSEIAEWELLGSVGD